MDSVDYNAGEHCVVQIKESLSQKHLASVMDSYEEANRIIHDYEVENSLKFATWILSKNFGNIDFYDKNHKIWWEDEIFIFSGVPFAILGSKILDCSYGKDRNLCAKRRRITNDSENPYKNPRTMRMTKKYGCPAQISIKELVHFPDFRISSNTKWKREAGSKRLRLAIKNKVVGNIKRSFVVLIPQLSSHLNHPNEVYSQEVVVENFQEQTTPTCIQTSKQPKKRPINLGPSCRNVLEEIKTLTYLIEDEGSIVKDLYTNLNALKSHLVFAIHEYNESKDVDHDLREEIIHEDTSPEHHQIVLTKNGKLERKKIEKQQQHLDENVLVMEQCEEQVIEDDGEDNSTLRLYIDSEHKHELTTTDNMNHNVKVITIHPSVIDSTGVIETSSKSCLRMADGGDENSSQENLNPQEFEVLTNMIHVLLEENKTTDNNTSDGGEIQ